MWLRSSCLCTVLLAAPLVAQVAHVSTADQAFLERWCVDCHGGDSVKGKLDLTKPAADPVGAVWRLARLRDRVSSGEMPPPDAERPPRDEALGFVARTTAQIREDGKLLPVDPGRVTVRRLSRGQWENCVRDLFGVVVPTQGFPADDLGYGFDSIGDALTFSTLHLEHYLAAATAVAESVLDGEDPLHPTVRRFAGEALPIVVNPKGVQQNDHLLMFARSEAEQVVVLPRSGEYRLRVRAGADQAGDEPAHLRLSLDGRELTTFAVERREMDEFELRVPIEGGSRRLALAFVNDYYDGKHPDPARRDRNLHVEWLEVQGPLDVRAVPEAQWLQRAWNSRGDVPTRLRALTKAVLPRAWRRPVGEDEVARVAKAAQQEHEDSGSPLRAARFVVQAALVSHHFLFRVEAGGASSTEAKAAPLHSVALASRLSFFLWASTPDEALAKLGRDGKLGDAKVLTKQVERLLDDPRADALATDFAAQWFELRSLVDRTPDPTRFPGFDDELRRSLRRETELLFRAVLRERLDVRRLLDADFTHVDARLAAHYGLPAVAGAEFVRVVLPESHRQRGGVLGHGSVLAVTSNPTRTSPVKRGKWILENLLGQAPPPPPPGNDSLPDEGQVDSTKSLREQLAQHRDRAACAGCHVRMDALGFALERYDVVGRHRERDAGGEIDCTGELPDGTRLAGLADLKRVLAADPAFVRTMAHKL
ncbi:MAG: DUF1592 domain-containing protein, partial [Planctomycetes bacterium]|nr:DUF1592 domain-containing protein [Planctomycetota bacterium]